MMTLACAVPLAPCETFIVLFGRASKFSPSNMTFQASKQLIFSNLKKKEKCDVYIHYKRPCKIGLCNFTVDSITDNGLIRNSTSWYILLKQSYWCLNAFVILKAELNTLIQKLQGEPNLKYTLKLMSRIEFELSENGTRCSNATVLICISLLGVNIPFRNVHHVDYINILVRSLNLSYHHLSAAIQLQRPHLQTWFHKNVMGKINFIWATIATRIQLGM